MRQEIRMDFGSIDGRQVLLWFWQRGTMIGLTNIVNQPKCEFARNVPFLSCS
jgi:hypothetical protein